MYMSGQTTLTRNGTENQYIIDKIFVIEDVFVGGEMEGGLWLGNQEGGYLKINNIDYSKTNR